MFLTHFFLFIFALSIQLHFAFGVGAFISPFVIGAVLAAYDGSVKVAFVILSLIGIPLILLLLRFPTPGKSESKLFYADPDLEKRKRSNSKHSLQGDEENIREMNNQLREETIPPPELTNVTSESSLTSSSNDFESSSSSSSSSSPSSSSSSSTITSPPPPPTPFFSRPRSELSVIFLVAGLLFFAVGLEVSTGSYVSTFSVKAPSLHFSELTGASLTASFWGLFTLSRFVAIVMSMYLTPVQMLSASLMGVASAVLV